MSLLKQLGVVVLLGALGGGGYLGWQHYSAAAVGPDEKGRRGGGRGAPVVETAAAAYRDLETVVEAVGSTRARRAVEITPLAAGRVTAIVFKAGQSVKAGEVLLRLDDEIQRADLIEAEARLKEARAALQRANSLKKNSAVAEASVDTLIAALATAEATRERATRRLRDRTVTAPFAGVVGFSRVEVGARVEDGDTVTTLDDLSQVEIEFSAPENLFGRIDVGQRIVADATAFPGRSFAGTVAIIDTRIDPLGRAFKVRALVDNPDLTLPAGMFMHLSVLLEARRALTVPEEAIVVDVSQAFVYAVTSKDGKDVAERREVTIGQRGFGYVEIVAGVADGEEVVVRGVQRVRDGVPVTRAGQGRGARTAAESPG